MPVKCIMHVAKLQVSVPLEYDTPSDAAAPDSECNSKGGLPSESHWQGDHSHLVLHIAQQQLHHTLLLLSAA